MTFLPNGYEKPAGNSNYFKFEEGDNKFRIMSSAIVGYEYWTTENQPVRSKEQFTETPNIKVDQNGKKRIRHFWAFIAWDYKEGKLKIMQITQSSIQDAILTLHSDEGWGDPKEYDLNVVRKGEIRHEYRNLTSWFRWRRFRCIFRRRTPKDDLPEPRARHLAPLWRFRCGSGQIHGRRQNNRAYRLSHR